MTHFKLNKLIFLGAGILWPIITLGGYFFGQCWYYDCGKWLLLQSLPWVGAIAILFLILGNTILFLTQKKLLKRVGVGLILVVGLLLILTKSGILYRVIYQKNLPAIVEMFACSDNCPGPFSQYFVKVFSEIKNPWVCLALGGKPSAIYGFGVRYICKAHWF